MARIDRNLLARYGIIQPTRHGDFHVVTPLHELTPEDKEDLMEFALMMCELDDDKTIGNAIEMERKR